MDNPEAKDTIEGIVEWWLLQQEIKWWTAEVNQALAELVSKQFVLAQKGKDLRTRYEVNPRKLDEIRMQLRSE